MIINDTETFVKSYDKAWERASKKRWYWFFDKHKKQHQHRTKVMRKWSFDEIERLKLNKKLSKQVMNNLLWHFKNYKSSDLFDVLVEENNGGFYQRTEKELKQYLDSTKKLFEFKKNAYYICVRMKTDIAEKYDPGLILKGLSKNVSNDECAEIATQAILNINEGESIFPFLQQQIEGLLKEGEFRSDFWEFGRNDFDSQHI